MRISVIVIWLFTLCCLSIAPFEVKHHLKTMGRMHNAGHFLAFSFTAFLLAWNSRTAVSRIFRCFLAFVFAAGVEYLEFFEYGHAYEWTDVLVDGTAIALVLLILTIWSEVIPERRTAT